MRLAATLFGLAAAAALLPAPSLASDFRLADAKNRVATVVDLGAIGGGDQRTVSLYKAGAAPVSAPGSSKLVAYTAWRYVLNCSGRQWRLVEMSTFDQAFAVVDDVLPALGPWQAAGADGLEPNAHFGLYCSTKPTSDKQLKRITGSTWQSALQAAGTELKR